MMSWWQTREFTPRDGGANISTQMKRLQDQLLQLELMRAKRDAERRRIESQVDADIRKKAKQKKKTTGEKSALQKAKLAQRKAAKAEKAALKQAKLAQKKAAKALAKAKRIEAKRLDLAKRKAQKAAVKKPRKGPTKEPGAAKARKRASREVAAKLQKAALSEAERQKRAMEKLKKQEAKEEAEQKLLKYETRLPKRKAGPAAVVRPQPPLNISEWRGQVSKLKPHQKDAVCTTLSSRQKGHIFWFGVGSGKTLSAITAAEQYGGAVVIVPATLRDNWMEELKKWQVQGDYEVVSYQQFYRHPIDLKGQFVIVDEAHALRSAGSKMARVIFNEIRRAHKVVLLSGTPTYNRPTDISVLLNPVRGPNDPKLVTNDELYEKEFGKHPESFAKLVRNNVVYYKPINDAVNYPTVTEKTITVDASPEQAEVYRALEEKNLNELLKLDTILKAKLDTAGAQADLNKAMQKLTAFAMTARQIANRDPRGAEYVPKVQQILKFIEKNPTKRVLVFSHFLESGLRQVATGLKARNIPYGVYTGEEKMSDRKKLIELYNDGKVRILLMSSAGAEGLDLKRTDVVISMEPHWNWSWVHQAIGRAARFQSHPPNSKVLVIKIVTRFPGAKMGGIELAMIKIANDKQRRIDHQNQFIIEESKKVVALRRPKCGIPFSSRA
jgi:SNF2 family DNA or RNA helicase